MKFIGILLISIIIHFCFNLNVFSKQLITYKSDAGKWISSNSVYVKQGNSIKLKLNIKASNVEVIKWYQIFPDISQYYKNANFPYEANPYKWIGFSKIKYNVVEITEFKNKSIVNIAPKLLKKNAPENCAFYNSITGSFWFSVKVVLKNGNTLKSPGIESNDYRGLSPSVFKISYIESNNYMGYLTSFFNVPGLFGSVPYQSKNYIGVDCADVLMAAYFILNNKKFKDYNVAMLVRKFKKIASFKIKNGMPAKKISWKKDFLKGDFIAVRYSPSSQFAHIGALYSDKNKNGILDENDLIMHAGPDALHVSPLRDCSFDGFVKILKNK